MAGTKAGAAKARAKNLAKDPDYYRNIGRKGGQSGTTGGFASTVIGRDGLTGRERAKKAGVVGGSISRRGPRKAVEPTAQENQRKYMARIFKRFA